MVEGGALLVWGKYLPLKRGMSRGKMPHAKDYVAMYDWRMIRILVAALLLATASGVGSQASAQPRPDALIAEADRLTDACRGGSGNDPATHRACAQQDEVGKRIRAAGWCWGPSNAYGYQQRWGTCSEMRRLEAQPAGPSAELTAARCRRSGDWYRRLGLSAKGNQIEDACRVWARLPTAFGTSDENLGLSDGPPVDFPDFAVEAYCSAYTQRFSEAPPGGSVTVHPRYIACLRNEQAAYNASVSLWLDTREGAHGGCVRTADPVAPATSERQPFYAMLYACLERSWSEDQYSRPRQFQRLP